jgi:phosphatidylglycerol:prolipoprotein diacylglycerol transferase
MPAQYTNIGPWSLQTFTVSLALAIVVSIGISLRRARAAVSGSPDEHQRAGRIADTYLGALIGGVLLARAGHVLLSWDYFADNLREAFDLRAGGLDWHGAVIGGLLGLYIMARLRRVSFRDALDALTPALPLIGLAGWWGCLAAACGYGVEVDTLANYPPLVVAELPDIFGIVAPRWNTPLFGLALSAFALLIALLLMAFGWLRYRRVWFILALLSLGMWGIGFWRADHSLFIVGLRADQWADGLLLVISVQQLAVSFRQRSSALADF